MVGVRDHRRLTPRPRACMIRRFPSDRDPADYCPTSVSRDEKRRLVNLGPYQPRLTSYPVEYRDDGGQKRSFLAICKTGWSTLLRMYCFTCRMPGTTDESWTSKGVQGANWKNAVKRIREHFREHFSSQYHHQSTLAMNAFLHYNPIDCQLDSLRAVEVTRRQIEISQVPLSYSQYNQVLGQTKHFISRSF